MGIVSRFGQKLGMPVKSGAWTSWAAASTEPFGATGVDANGVIVTGSDIRGWFPWHGYVPFENKGWPLHAGMNPATTYNIDWNFTMPFGGHALVKAKFTIEYPSIGAPESVQEGIFRMGINTVVGVASADADFTWQGGNNPMRIHRSNSVATEYVPVEMRMPFWAISGGAHVLRMQCTMGGGSGIFRMIQQTGKIHCLPYGNVFQINGTQIG